MRSVIDSDVYQKALNKNNSVNSKIAALVMGKSHSVILNGELESDFDTMIKVFKSPVTIEIVNAIHNNQMDLFTTDLASKFPSCMPFVKYSKGGEAKVAVDLSAYATEKKDSDSGKIEYKIDAKKLYVLCLPAYLTLKLFDKNTVLPPVTISKTALMWAKMFNKILNRTIGLTLNKERYEAYMYFAMKFYMIYILNCPQAVVDSVTKAYLKNDKGYLINFMEDRINTKKIDFYGSFETFCHTLFDNEISNIKGVRVNNLSEEMNYKFYMQKFIETYRFQSLLSLSSFPYFLFVLIASYNYSDIVSDRAFEDIVLEDSKDLPSVLASLYKEL
jgi:hypothetical protein